MGEIPNAIEGAEHTPYGITWTFEDGTALDLTGAVITGLANNLADGINKVLPSSRFTITDALNGKFDWVIDPTDVDTPGTFEVQFTATFSPTIAKTFRAEWVVEAAVV